MFSLCYNWINIEIPLTKFSWACEYSGEEDSERFCDYFCGFMSLLAQATLTNIFIFLSQGQVGPGPGVA